MSDSQNGDNDSLDANTERWTGDEDTELGADVDELLEGV